MKAHKISRFAVRMLVTGTHGFIGSTFCKSAQQKFDVIPVSRIEKGPLPRAEFLVHLAARTAMDKRDTTSLNTYRRDNVTGTKQLLRRLTNKPSHMLYVSTMDVTKKPLTPYAQSKLEAEKVIAEYCTKNHISFGIARLGSVFGPGEGAYGKVIPTFIKSALEGKELIITDPKATRKFIYVDDVARTLLDCLKGQKAGFIPVVGVEETVIGELAKRINRLIHTHEKPADFFDKQLLSEINWFQKRRVIFFDVDGTILNHWKRMYTLYQTYCRNHGLTVLSEREYKEKKWPGAGDTAILGIDKTKSVQYLAWKRGELESTKSLAMDSLIPGMKNVLITLAKTYTPVAVSARQYGSRLRQEFKIFGIKKYFTEIIAVGNIAPAVKKQEAMEAYLATHRLDHSQAIVVGDTEMEVVAAKKAGIRCISVTWGTRSDLFLRVHGAQMIVHTPARLLEALRTAQL